MTSEVKIALRFEPGSEVAEKSREFTVGSRKNEVEVEKVEVE